MDFYVYAAECHTCFYPTTNNEMLNNEAMVLSRNGKKLQEKEMRCVNGGNHYVVVTGGALYLAGYNASTAFTRNVRRRGRLYKVTYTPKSGVKKLGKALKVTGVGVGTAGFSTIIGIGIGILSGLKTYFWD